MRRALSALVLLGSLPAHAEQPFAALADEAAANSPTLASLHSRESALRTRADVAGAWSDPMLGVEYSNAPIDSFALDRNPMSGLQFRVEQKLPTPGSTRMKREAGTARADATEAMTREAELQLRARVVEAGWLLTRSRLLEQLTRDHLARTEDLLSSALSRYETGSVGQFAVLRLEVLRDKLTDELGDYARTERELTAALGAALGLREARAIDTPDAVDPMPPPTEADWLTLAREHRPLLQQLGAEAAAAGASAALAGREVAPDVTLWAGYRWRFEQGNDPGTDFVSLGLGVPIPSGSARRGSGERSAWLEEASASQIAQEAALDQIAAQTDACMARWSRAWEKAQTYQHTLLPGAESTLKATQSDFSVGRAEFASLFEAEITLLDLERAVIVAAIDTHLQHNALVAAIGTPPPEASP